MRRMNPYSKRQAYFCPFCQRSHTLQSKVGQEHYPLVEAELAKPSVKEPMTEQQVQDSLLRIFRKGRMNPDEMRYRASLLRELKRLVQEGRIPQRYLHGAVWLDTQSLEDLVKRHRNPLRFQCSTCYKVYHYWRACARHITRTHGGYGIILEAKSNPFAEALVYGLGAGLGFGAANIITSRGRR